MSLTEPKEAHAFIAGAVGRIDVKTVTPAVDGPLFGANFLAVICHPNPTRGGDMNNKVVTTLLRAYRDLGVRAVAFNFRGVGKSEGEFDNGVGEQDDLRAVLAWAAQQYQPASLLLAGFSFGSSIAAAVSHECTDVKHLVLVAPPVDRYRYEREGRFNSPVCVVQGDLDELIPASDVYQWIDGLRSEHSLIRYPDAGHFFHGYLTQLKMDLGAALSRALTD